MMWKKTNIAQRRLETEVIENHFDKYEVCGCSIEAEKADKAIRKCGSCLHGTGECFAQTGYCCAACGLIAAEKFPECVGVCFATGYGLYKCAKGIVCSPYKCAKCIMKKKIEELIIFMQK